MHEVAFNINALPSVVIGRVEGGVERWLKEDETPDGRLGLLAQFWGVYEPRKHEECLRRFAREISYRIRQGILVKPFTNLFNALESELKIDMMPIVGHCGDGWEWEEERYGRKLIVVPIMVPDFRIERYLCCAKGVMGGNFWYYCTTKQAVLEAGRRALNAISEVRGVVAPFGICSAGSKPETKFPEIGPTTNHPYCPSLKGRLGRESKVPEGVCYIPEIVVNGISLERVKEALRAGIEAAAEVEGVVGISAGNYGGKLGRYRIYLRELLS